MEEGSRPPFDQVPMFRILMIQKTLNNLSVERKGYPINDSLPFAFWDSASRIGRLTPKRSGCSAGA
ncbi:transposase insH for insertion sequence element IS5H [Gluconobacter morbifer G707]|uniref:Transposase insH for insertion sequence element IS5H n=1 Tax=Gluconobacter morbifer G707 TaxID=1088869 RepID=G6XHL6_9PROT|nr:transposase insH for insertion sequence element IS5H [Gluconobacter morbifer G707]